MSDLLVSKAVNSNQKNKRAQLEELDYRDKLFMSNPIPMWIYDLETLAFLDVNRAAVAKYGYSHAEFLALTIKDIRPAEDITRLLDDMAQKRPSLQDSGEWRHQLKNGRIIDVEITSHTIEVNGRQAALVMAHDITERKLAAQKLAATTDRLNHLLDASPSIIYALKVEGDSVKSTWVSKNITQLLGYSAVEALHPGWWVENLYPEDRDTTLNNMGTLFSQGFLIHEYRFYRKDKSVIWISDELRFVPDENGNRKEIVGTWTDITERKQKDAALKQSIERDRYISKLISDYAYVFVIKPDGNVVGEWLSGSFIRTFGLTIEEIEMQGGWYTMVHPDDLALALAHLQKVFNGQSDTCELRFLTKAGESRWIRDYAAPVWDESHSRVVRIYGAAQDISEQKQAEKERQQNTSRLQRLWNISQYQTENEQEFLDYALHEALKLTESEFGYIYHYDDEEKRFTLNSWSTAVMDACKIVEPQTQYELEKTGIWGEAVRQRKPIVVNDFQASNPYKKGYPHGHVEFHNYLTFPVFQEERIVAVVGVANKKSDYDNIDVQQLRLMMDSVWKIIRRRQADDQLRLQSAALMAAANAITITDKTGIIQWINPAFSQLTGYNNSEAIGKNPRELLKSGMHDELFYQNLWEAILSGQVWRGEFVNRRKDGSLYTEEKTITPLLDESGTVRQFIAVGHDVTKRQELENERVRLLTKIREQMNQVRQIIDTVPEGVLLLDSKGFVMLTNPLADKFLGLLAKYGEDGLITHLGHISLSALLISPTDGNWHQLTSGERHFTIMASPMKNGHDTEQWVLIINDVTDMQARHRYQQAQERLATVGQLAAGIAHDFNNVMGVITLYSDMLLKKPDLPVNYHKHLALIHKQARHASNLITQILDFSRRSVLERSSVNLLHIVKEQVKLLERTLPESIRLKLTYEQKGYVIKADPTRLQQALMNLALNARDAMPEGGSLHFALSELNLTEGQSPPLPDMEKGLWVKLEVADTGEGVSLEHISHLFEPFFTTKAPGKGSGLGLAQVYGIIKQHGGSIDVTSQLDKGAVFSIYLPLLETAVPIIDEKLDTKAPPRGKETILVVEDNPAMRLSVIDVLTGLGYHVLAAVNGDEAMAMLENGDTAVQLILSDLVMPEMGGLELLKSVRQKLPGTKMLIMTGHPLDQDKNKLLSMGVVGLIHKPFDIAVLAEKVRMALDK